MNLLLRVFDGSFTFREQLKCQALFIGLSQREKSSALV